MPKKLVRDIMSTQLVSLMEADNLATVAADFDVYRFRHLPVVDGKKLVGIVSERDFLRASVSALDTSAVASKRSQQLENTFVRALMAETPKTVSPEASVSEAAELLVEHRIGCLPVVDGEGSLLGIVTEYDVLVALARD